MQKKRLFFRPVLSGLRYGVGCLGIITLEVYAGGRATGRVLALALRRIYAREELFDRASYRVVFSILGPNRFQGIQTAALTAEGGVAGFYDLGPSVSVFEAHERLKQPGSLLADPVDYYAQKRARAAARTRYRRRVPYHQPATRLPF